MQRQLRALKESRESQGLPALQFDQTFHPRHGRAETSVDPESSGLPFAVGIPDTVVYEHNFPQAWYTYDQKSRELSKQSGKYLDVQEIYKGFSTVHEGCADVCAQFVGLRKRSSNSGGDKSPRRPAAAASGDSWVRPPTARTLSFTTRADPSTSYIDGADSVAIEHIYFTPETLLAWLRDKGTQWPLKEGILQVFIPPRGDRNDCLQMIWSPTTCKLTRRSNLHSLQSMRLDTRTKCATFDAPSHLVDESAGNELVKRQIHDALSTISQHLVKSEHKIVSRFVAFFKHDCNGVLWLLHCGSIRVQNSEMIGSCVVLDPVDLDATYSKPPSACGNDVIDTALKLNTTMQPVEERWRQFNTVHRADETTRSSLMRHLQRRDTKLLLRSAEQWTARSSQAPHIVKELSRFVEDTLYSLFAARMTTSKATAELTDVVVRVPKSVADFLDTVGIEQLMVKILGMEPVDVVSDSGATGSGATAPRSMDVGAMSTDAAPCVAANCNAASKARIVALPSGHQSHIFRLQHDAGRRPLSIVRTECEGFIKEMRTMFATEGAA